MESQAELKEKYLKKAQDLIKRKHGRGRKGRSREEVSWSMPLTTSTPLNTRRNHSVLSPHPLLDAQLKINTELKRLLLASVGSELGLEIEGLIRDKVRLEQRLDTSLTQLLETNEEIDSLTVECDVWKSKVLASRLLIDELKEWKQSQYHLTHKAIETMLREREELTSTLKDTHEVVNGIGRLLQSNPVHHHKGVRVATVSPVQLQPSVQGCTVIELAKSTSVAMQMISDKICERQEATPIRTTPKTVYFDTSLTEGEKLAQKVLHPGPQATPTNREMPHLSFSERHLMEQRRKVTSSSRSLPWTDGHEVDDVYYCCKCRDNMIKTV